jgi:hypothetical protein
MEQKANWSWDIFVSHNRKQKPWVRRFVRQCRDSGLRVFFDQDDIGPGEEVVAGIERGLKQSQHVIVVISPEAVSSDWVAFEIAISVGIDPSGSRRKLIPILLEKTPPEDIRLSVLRLNFVDLTEPALRRKQYCKLFEFFGISPAPRIPNIGQAAKAHRAKPKNPMAAGPLVKQARAFSPLTPETGAMDPQSPYYVGRLSDGQAVTQLDSVEPTVTIRGFRKAGKSSLLNRLQYAARRDGVRCCYIDFQGVGEDYVNDNMRLCKQIAHLVAGGLGVASRPEANWDEDLAPQINLTKFIESEILRPAERPVQLLFDEVDMLLKTGAGAAFFSTLRSWHNRRETDYNGIWKRLRFAIAHASDPAVWIPSTDQSPFNVGLNLVLEEFTPPQVAELNRRLGSPLRSDSEVRSLVGLVGGHPYLVRRSLHSLLSGDLSFARFLETASLPDGPLGNYLTLYFNQVLADTDLLHRLRKILSEGVCPDKHQFDQLWATGLVTGYRHSVRLRCRLYEEFFRSVLP